ncbi:MAG: conjugal transfer protein TraB [Deltaproteobacteria bacterium]|nr:conjugal transfer protein TraB [Deltaproteobacteria bacterium]
MSASEKTPMDPETRRVRQRQVLLFSGIAAAALVVFAVWISAGGGGGSPPPSGIEAELVGSETAEASWVRRSEARIGELETRLREMETRRRRSEQENADLRERLARNAEDGRVVIDQQAAAIEEMRRRLEDRPATAVPAGADGAGRGAGRPVSRGKVPGPADGAAAPMIQEFENDAAPPPGDGAAARGPRSLKLWLPAGSYADAVVLAGVDASVGVTSQGDPRPVLLRLTGPARSAAEGGEALEADVAGCTLTGAAYGDLSSEKVYVRLRTLTCAGPGRETVIETQVAGFVAGSGKVGVRGPVVSREGALVEKAFLAGLISGAGETAANALQTPAGGTGEGGGASLADLGRAGLGGGAGSAGRRVADYLIRRAEQYQPVIQLQTGTQVTVVFIEGARIDGRGEGRSGSNGRRASK